MDVYLTNSSYVPQSIIDNYESFIWKDGFRGEGDFEMTLPWRADLASSLKSLKYLVQSESDRVMTIETAFVDRPRPNLKSNLVKVSGSCIENILDLRDNKSSVTGGLDPVLRTGSRAAAANYFVDQWCVTAPGRPLDVLEGLSIGTPPTGPSVELTVARGKIGEIVKQILLPDNLGFKMMKRRIGSVHQPGQLVFQVYKGVDRSNAVPSQSPDAGPLVVFSPDGENLVDISTLSSIAVYKNHARVIGAKAGVNAYAPGTLSTVSGYARRTVVIEAFDVGADSTTTVEEDQIVLTQRGLEALNSEENRYQQLVDGSVPQNDDSFSVVGLGDIVLVRDSNGNQNKARIAEKVWTADRTGVKRLPTFEAV